MLGWAEELVGNIYANSLQVCYTVIHDYLSKFLGAFYHYKKD